jgi:CheY-like chemotaxis protein
MSGQELIQRLRSEGPNKDTPVLITTVLADQSGGLAMPIHDYLLKPIQPSRLIASLAAVGAAPHSGETVLVVDDDAKTAKLIEPVLREWGYKTIFAVSGAAALKLVESERPFALIVDMMMPEMSGIEFLSRFRVDNANRDLPVIIMTAKDLGSEELRQLETLAQSVVQKGTGATLDLLEALRECAPIRNSGLTL